MTNYEKASSCNSGNFLKYQFYYISQSQPLPSPIVKIHPYPLFPLGLRLYLFSCSNPYAVPTQKFCASSKLSASYQDPMKSHSPLILPTTKNCMYPLQSLNFTPLQSSLVRLASPHILLMAN